MATGDGLVIGWEAGVDDRRDEVIERARAVAGNRAPSSYELATRSQVDELRADLVSQRDDVRDDLSQLRDDVREVCLIVDQHAHRVAELQGRVNGVLWMVGGAIVIDVVMRLIRP